MIVDRETHDLLVEAVEDAVEYAVQGAYTQGVLLSGETAWNIVWARAAAKVAEFEGLLAPRSDEEHY
jgi:hypothetical protein